MIRRYSPSTKPCLKAWQQVTGRTTPRCAVPRSAASKPKRGTLSRRTCFSPLLLRPSESDPKRSEFRQHHHGSASPALAQRRGSRGELHPINSNNPQRRTHHIPLLRDKDMATKRRDLVTSARAPLLKPGERKEGSSVERHVDS